MLCAVTTHSGGNWSTDTRDPAPTGVLEPPGQTGGPGQNGSPGQPPGRTRRHKVIRASVRATVLLAVVAVIAVIALSSRGTGSTPAAQGTFSASAGTQQSAAARSDGSGPAGNGPAANGPEASSSVSEPATGPVGTAYQVRSSVGNYVYKVTLVRVDPDARGSDGTGPGPGTHFVGVEFSVAGVSGSSANEDAFSDATVQGSNGQTYQGPFAGITDGTSFDSGAFGPAPGATQVGWLPFQLPDGVSVTSVQWSQGSQAPTVTWHVG
jgi:hypothetical protein